MHLTDLLNPACVKAPLAATDKRGAIEELVGLLAGLKTVADAEAVLAAVLQREATRTTGIGNGLAIPHGKTPAVSELLLAVGKPATPIDFESIDNEPVDLIVLLVSPPDQAGPHIQALARISRLMTDKPFRRHLGQARDGQAVYDLIVRQDAALP